MPCTSTHRTLLPLVRLAAAAGFAALLVASLAPLHAQEQMVIKLASREVEDSPTAQHLAAFARWVHEHSHGAVRVKLLLGARLGSAESLAQRTADGTLQAFAGTAQELARVVPELQVLEAAGVLADRKRLEAKLDGPLRTRVAALLAERNLVFGSWSAGAFRAWFAREAPVQAPSALKGLRVASRAGAADASAPYGTTPIALLEAARPGALEASRVDALDAEPLEALASEAQRGARHLALCEHAYVPRLIVYSKSWFDGLPDQLQKDLAAPPEALLQDARKAAEQANAEAVQLLGSSGVQVHTCSAPEHRAFVKQARPSADALARALGAAASALLGAARD